MTKQQIIKALNEIEKCKKEAYYFEAIVKNYHLNISVLRYMLSKLSPNKSEKSIKAKEILSLLIEEVSSRAVSKMVISKKSLKNVKPWLIKIDSFLKSVKQKYPSNVKSLLNEGEQIFVLLNISYNKMQTRAKINGKSSST